MMNFYQNCRDKDYTLRLTPALKASLVSRNTLLVSTLITSLSHIVAGHTRQSFHRVRWNSLITLVLLPGLEKTLKNLYFKFYGINTSNWLKGCQYWSLKSAIRSQSCKLLTLKGSGLHDVKFFLTNPVLGIFIGGRRARWTLFRVLRIISYNWQPWNAISAKRLGYQCSLSDWKFFPFWNEYYFRVYNL